MEPGWGQVWALGWNNFITLAAQRVYHMEVNREKWVIACPGQGGGVTPCR